MKKLILLLLIVMSIGSCKKDKVSCDNTQVQIQPFVETTTNYQCNGNNEYTYILRRQGQVDSLQPNCFATGPLAFPINDIDMVYIIVGRMSYYHNNILQTSLFRNSCAKKLIYNINMIQKTDTLESNGGGILSVFCEVDSIPADYDVEVNYKYVPLTP